MPPLTSPDSLHKVAASGDRAATLRALRDSLAADMDVCESMRDKAALSARFLDVLTQIDALPAEKKGTALDDLAARRSGRVGVAAREVRAKQRTAD